MVKRTISLEVLQPNCANTNKRTFRPLHRTIPTVDPLQGWLIRSSLLPPRDHGVKLLSFMSDRARPLRSGTSFCGSVRRIGNAADSSMTVELATARERKQNVVPLTHSPCRVTSFGKPIPSSYATTQWQRIVPFGNQSNASSRCGHRTVCGDSRDPAFLGLLNRLRELWDGAILWGIYQDRLRQPHTLSQAGINSYTGRIVVQ
jgi:hypothetical protein